MPAARGSAMDFQKPNLPPLAGAPSARKQYAYGAVMDPLPARPAGTTVELGDAVKNALVEYEVSYSDGEEEEELQPELVEYPYSQDTDEDEASRSEDASEPSDPSSSSEECK